MNPDARSTETERPTYVAVLPPELEGIDLDAEMAASVPMDWETFDERLEAEWAKAETEGG